MIVITEQMWAAALETFGKPKVYAAWPQIAKEAEHALWVVWNPRYGPLTSDQREYASGLICAAIRKGIGHPNPYGAFYRWLRSFYNDERVDAGFKARREKVETNFGGLLGEVAA